MKRLLLLLLAGTLAALLLGTWLIQDPGYVRILRDHWEVETTLAFTVLVLVLAALALVLLTLTLTSLFRLVRPPQAASWSRRRGRRQLRTGLHALVEGNWRKARQRLRGAAQNGDWPLPALLGAALAARAGGNAEEAQSLLDQAVDEPDGTLPTGLLSACMELCTGDAGQARERLEALRREHPGNPLVLHCLARACEEDGHWETLTGVLATMESLPRAGSVTPPRQRRAWQGRLRAAAERPGFNNHGARLEELRRLWKKQVPSYLRDEPQLVASYAGYLAQLGDGTGALRCIERALRQGWDDRLPVVLEAIEDVPPEKLLTRLETWLAERPANTALLRTAGRVALRARLWGKARGFFEAAARNDDPLALAELARLHEALGNNAQARHCLEQRMRLLGNSLPELPLPESGASARGERRERETEKE